MKINWFLDFEIDEGRFFLVNLGVFFFYGMEIKEERGVLGGFGGVEGRCGKVCMSSNG